MKMTENNKKTIIGIISAIMGFLVFMGVITPEQVEGIDGGIDGLLENIAAAVFGVAAVWGIFTGGKDKE